MHVHNLLDLGHRQSLERLRRQPLRFRQSGFEVFEFVFGGVFFGFGGGSEELVAVAPEHDLFAEFGVFELLVLSIGALEVFLLDLDCAGADLLDEIDGRHYLRVVVSFGALQALSVSETSTR